MDLYLSSKSSNALASMRKLSEILLATLAVAYSTRHEYDNSKREVTDFKAIGPAALIVADNATLPRLSSS